MEELLRDYNERKQEIDCYYKFLRKISSKSYAFKNTRKQQDECLDDRIIKILKANIFLLLYNLIESTTDKAIEYVCVKITSSNIKYNEIIEDIKAQWSKVQTKCHLKTNDEGALRKGLKQILDKTINDYIKFENQYKLKYRDNIDSNELRKIAKDFGFTLEFATSLKGGKSLDKILQKRNNLAHGSMLFSDCGRDYTLTDLIQYKNDTYKILEKFLKTIDTYIKKQKYKSN